MTASPTLIGIGSGLVTAVLFASLVNNTVLALALFYLLPLPVLLAGLGWGVRAALLSCVTAIALVALFIRWQTGLGFGICIGVPGVILAYLTLLRRQIAPASASPRQPPQIEWYPLGTIIAWAAVIAGSIVAIALIMFALAGGTFETYLRGVRLILAPELLNRLEMLIGPDAGPGGVDRFIDRFSRIVLPSMMTSGWMVVMLANLWMAAKSASISSLLDRPVPDITRADYPPFLAAGLFAAIGLGFVPGLPGVVGAAFAGAFGCALAILGMGVIHVVLGRTIVKPVILVLIYLGLFLTPWIAPIVALIGLVEPFLQLRQRSMQPTTPPGNGGGHNH